MSKGQLDRRRLLTFGATTALGVWSGFGSASLHAAAARQGNLADNTALQFTVTIPGLPAASTNIRDIAIDELNVDARRTTGRDGEFWTIHPGRIHFGSARFTSLTTGGSRELRTWWNEAAKGKNIRKNITVTLFRSDRKSERVYQLADCFPTSYSATNFDTSSTVQTETLTVQIGRIEFKT